MNWLARSVARHLNPILVAALAITLACAWSLFDPAARQLRITLDPSFQRMLPDDDPEIAFYDRARELFGNEESFVVVMEAEDLFSEPRLRLIKRLTERFAAIHGVSQVVSLANAMNIRGTAIGLDVAPLMKQVPTSPEDIAELRDRAVANPMYRGTLLSEDLQATALVLHLSAVPGQTADASAIDAAIQAVLAPESESARFLVTGLPRIQAATNRALTDELTWIPLLVGAVMAAVLAVFFRTSAGVLVPLIIVAIGVVWTLAAAVWLGLSLNMLTVLVPPLLMTLGTAYVVHVVADFHEVAGESTNHSREQVIQVIQGVGLPVILTGVTTIIGFGSLLLSSIPAIREFGLLSVIGVACTTGLSLLVAPALLVRFRYPRRRQTDGKQTGFNLLVARVAAFDLHNRKGIFIGCLAVVALALLGASRIQVGTDHIGNFAPEHPVRADFEAVNARFGGANVLQVIIEAPYKNAFKEPAVLRQLAELQAWLDEQARIGGTSSIADYVKLIHQAINENDPAFHSIPEKQAMLSQLLFFAASEEMNHWVDRRFQTTNLVVRSRVIGTRETAELVTRIEARLAQLYPDWQTHVTGNSVLMNRAIDDIVEGQARSVGLTLLLVYVVLAILFTSARIGLLALLPNVVPTLVYFGALGAFGISLNGGTSVIAPIVLGIAIDDTVHYFVRFTRYAHRMLDEQKAAVHALKVVGRPITYTTVGLCLGFLMLMSSDLRMQAEVGMMGAFALAVAWLSDFILTPALCAGVRIATLWDVLTLDLGEQPQKSIPLLKGLCNSQARIVALMAEIRKVPAGQRLIREGEKSDGMYILLDGELQVSIERDGNRIPINSHRRGSVCGEVGLYRSTRSADVDVTEDARMLRLTEPCIKRLQRRYPRIAAQVLANLNEILIERLVNATNRIT